MLLCLSEKKEPIIVSPTGIEAFSDVKSQLLSKGISNRAIDSQVLHPTNVCPHYHVVGTGCIKMRKIKFPSFKTFKEKRQKHRMH